MKRGQVGTVGRFTISAPVCERCGESFEPRANTAKYCDTCQTADPYRNTRGGKGRPSESLPEIIVHVDTEGDGEGNITSASFGREDGTSGSIISDDAVEIIMWWLDNLTGLHNGQRQIIQAFHFNYDTAVLAKFTDTRKMQLINKAKTKGGIICTKDSSKCKCKRPHAFRPKDNVTVITTGAEENVLSWDKDSKLALAASPRRRFYVEYRPNGWEFKEYKSLDIHDVGTAFVGGLERVIDSWQPDLSDDERKFIAWGKQARTDSFKAATQDQLTNYAEAQKVREHNSDRLSKSHKKILAWGDGRSSIPNGFDDDTIAHSNECIYSETECIAASRCVRILLDTVSEAADFTIKANALFGSGSLASAAFRSHGLAKHDELAKHDDIDLLPLMTYFGGLIEAPVVGIIRGIAHEEDLNSAYPAAMIHLPCMLDGHGHWIQKKQLGLTPKDLNLTGKTVGHALLSWKVKAKSTPPFMVRDKQGCVFQPLQGWDTWVTIPEWLAAAKQFPGRHPNGIFCTKVVWWEQTCDCPPPLAWLSGLYDKRLLIKSQMSNLEKYSPEWHHLNCQQNALKLVINSCYGKLAQWRPRPGRYANYHWASHITGTTRAKVRERTWLRESKGSIVCYQHTDSVLSVGRKPHHSQVGEALGEWGLEDKETVDTFVLQPGLMMGINGGKIATRGVSQSAFEKSAEDFSKTHDFKRHPKEWDDLVIPTRRMITRKMAIAIRRKPWQAGVFEDSTLESGVSWSKRDVENAVQIPGQPEAWFLPPLDYVDNEATIKDVQKLRARFEKTVDTEADYAEELGHGTLFDDADD